MQHNKSLHIKLLLFCFVSLIAKYSTAQNGSIDAVFTDQTGKKTELHVSEPTFQIQTNDGLLFNKQENGADWFTHPSSGKSRFSIEEIRYFRGNKKSYTIPEINFYLNKGENDFSISASDKNQFTISTEKIVIEADKSFHIHINRFTETEIDLNYSGAVSYNAVNGSDKGSGNMEGKLHLYRKANQYGKTDKLQGCNCDPTIYLWQYLHGEGYARSLSACELAFKKKLFNAMQLAMQPVYKLNDGNNGTLKNGGVSVMPCVNCINTNTSDNFSNFCNDIDDGYHGVANVGSEKRYWQSEDQYGLRIISSPDNDMPQMNAAKASAEKLKEMMTDYQNKKISMEELQKKMKDLENDPQIKKENDDFKKAEILNDLTAKITVNPETEAANVGLNDATTSQIQHKISHAVAEVFSPASKNSDGSWNKDKLIVYIGKFSSPVIGKNSYGKQAALSKISYPVNGNKLSAYGIIVTFTGDKRLTDKAISNLNWDALSQLLNN